MANPHYYVPAGMPPGEGPRGTQEGPPEGVYFYRVFGGLMCGLCALLVAAGIRGILMPLTSSTSPASALAMPDFVLSVMGVGAGIVGIVPVLLSLFGGRHPWVHTLGTVLIALTMLPMCCLPISIPMLVVWIKPETKRWYGAA